MPPEGEPFRGLSVIGKSRVLWYIVFIRNNEVCCICFLMKAD